jgi:putative component of membrane protein insertase Oxa1/YidC/SpoIIIJ protein YidD
MKIVLTILLFLLTSELYAQSIQHQDIALLNQAFSTQPKVRLGEQFSLSRENPNELQAVFSGLFLFYKSFLSSQDNQRCSFHPSCSEFGLEAVKKFGVVRGIICTCDRLTRCNGFSPQQYEIDLEHRRLNDPVEW